MKTIFVSYSQPDDKIGASIVERLKQEGFIVWFAPEELHPGGSFAEIFDQIDRCDAFAVLLSPNSAKSPWVNKGLDIAITRQLSARPLLLVPIYLEPMDPLRKVADLKPIDLCGQWEKRLELLVAQLQGREKDGGPSMQSFEHFLNSLVRIDDAQKVEEALLLSSMAGRNGNRPQTRPCVRCRRRYKPAPWISLRSSWMKRRSRRRIARAYSLPQSAALNFPS